MALLLLRALLLWRTLLRLLHKLRRRGPVWRRLVWRRLVWRGLPRVGLLRRSLPRSALLSAGAPTLLGEWRLGPRRLRRALLLLGRWRGLAPRWARCRRGRVRLARLDGRGARRGRRGGSRSAPRVLGRGLPRTGHAGRRRGCRLGGAHGFLWRVINRGRARDARRALRRLARRLPSGSFAGGLGRTGAVGGRLGVALAAWAGGHTKGASCWWGHRKIRPA